MSWYLFNNSPERQYRGKKVDGYQNRQNTRVNLDWGLGQLSPKKTQNVISKTIQKPARTSKSEYEQPSHLKTRNIQKHKIISQAVKILTQSSDDQGKQELIRVLKNYDKKLQKQQKPSNTYHRQSNAYHRQSSAYNIQINAQLPVMDVINKNRSNRSMNVLNSLSFESGKTTDHSKSNINVDLETAKQMRFLQNNLLPDHKRDNMSAILDFNLNEKVSNDMSESRLSGKSHFGNKKNESAVQLGDGFNVFVPMRQKVKDMNQRLKEMYDYDEWCRKREKSELKLA